MEKIHVYRILMGRLKERDHLEDHGIDEKMILKWMINTVVEKVRIGFFWAGIWIMMGPFKRCNEHMGFLKCREFIILLLAS
jgi:hypothetical protein